MLIKSLLKKSNLFNLFRNSFNRYPSVYISPDIKKTSISDFFYFNVSNDFDTKLMVFNLSSHVLPEIKQKERVKLFFFNDKGKNIAQNEFTLNYQETTEILISDFLSNTHGSFFAFHIFNDFGDLLENNSFITERGYIAYKFKNSLWSFMHGNHNAAYLDNNNKIHSILARSYFKKNYYSPQVSFLDQDEFELVFNNPTYQSNILEIIEKDENGKIIKRKNLEINSFGTKVYKSQNKIRNIEIGSNLILNRPIIIKNYNGYLDIFHG